MTHARNTYILLDIDIVDVDNLALIKLGSLSSRPLEEVFAHQ